MRAVAHDDLVARALRDEREFVARFGPASLSRPARIFIEALAQRLNGHPILVAVPGAIEPAARPEVRFAAWLDAGAPGFAEAACECMVEDVLGMDGRVVGERERRYVSFEPGPVPAGGSCSRDELVARMRWLLTDCPVPYGTVLAEPERVLQDFVAAELGEARAHGWAAFSVDPTSLEHRTGYFERLGCDACLGWTDGSALKVLFTNGSD